MPGLVGMGGGVGEDDDEDDDNDDNTGDQRNVFCYIDDSGNLCYLDATEDEEMLEEGVVVGVEEGGGGKVDISSNGASIPPTPPTPPLLPTPPNPPGGNVDLVKLARVSDAELALVPLATGQKSTSSSSSSSGGVGGGSSNNSGIGGAFATTSGFISSDTSGGSAIGSAIGGGVVSAALPSTVSAIVQYFADQVSPTMTYLNTPY